MTMVSERYVLGGAGYIVGGMNDQVSLGSETGQAVRGSQML